MIEKPLSPNSVDQLSSVLAESFNATCKSKIPPEKEMHKRVHSGSACTNEILENRSDRLGQTEKKSQSTVGSRYQEGKATRNIHYHHTSVAKINNAQPKASPKIVYNSFFPPQTARDKTRFYHSLVQVLRLYNSIQSDFAYILGAASFCKSPRIQEGKNNSPGPGQYNSEKKGKPTGCAFPRQKRAIHPDEKGANITPSPQDYYPKRNLVTHQRPRL